MTCTRTILNRPVSGRSRAGWLGLAWVLIPLVGLFGFVPAAQAAQTDPCAHPANPVVAENCKPGSSDWQIEAPSFEISGFSSPTSVNAGESIDFYVTATASKFDLWFYRIGYYGGAGGRQVLYVPGVPARRQPPCLEESSTGLRSCSNWSLSYTLQVPAAWVSGVYLARWMQPDGQQSSTVFVVRADGVRSDLLYQQSVTTYQAYNNYGGKSLYSHNSSDCLTVAEAPRAVKVSFDRPYNAPMIDPSSFFRAEYPMVRWLESQGYWVTYSTNVDTHHSGEPGQPNRLLEHKAFLSVGHDEYWSAEMRAAAAQALEKGVSLAFFSANTSYWKIRLEPDPWTHTPDRVIVAYKTTESGGPDPSGIPTGTWRDPKGANQPENSLLGVEYIGDDDTLFFPFRVPAELASDRVYRNTGLQGLPPGTYVDIGKQLLGWEWDAVVDNGFTPPGVVKLSASPVTGELLVDAGKDSVPGKAVSNAARYTAPSGAMVFAAGTIQWSWGLDVHEPDRRIQQITYNVLSDMGAQPATPASSLVLDGTQATPPPTGQATRAQPGSAPVVQLSQPVTETSSTGATIRWETNTPTNGQIWMLLPSGVLNATMRFENGSQLDENYQIQHSFTFEDLAPNTEYAFRFISDDPHMNVGVSPIYRFQTPAGSRLYGVEKNLQQVGIQLVCIVKPPGRQIRYALQMYPGLFALVGGGLLVLLVGMVLQFTTHRRDGSF